MHKKTWIFFLLQLCLIWSYNT